MRIRKPLAIVIGLFTIWPFIYMLLFIGVLVIAALTIVQQAHQQHAPGQAFLPYIFIPHIATILLMFALMAFYIVHVFKNADLKDDRRVLWAVVLFMGLPVSAPVYWWLFIWRPARGDASV
jgi:hypothetical protein